MAGKIQTLIRSNPVQTEASQLTETPGNLEEKTKEIINAPKGRNWLKIFIFIILTIFAILGLMGWFFVFITIYRISF